MCVVDDDASVRNGLGNLLKSLGYSSVGFASGEEFLASSATEEADCVLLDLMMKGMQGLEVLQHLKAAGNRVAVFCMSAQDDEGTIRRTLEAGALGFLRKPFSEEALLDSIKQALERK
ncbi:two-component system response regulator [Pseudomonas caspiana]|uniref:Two-component system response regulator n=1 Tax=Pseudomonas caspiana TaxID=1451454 RepID=A0A1Y3P0S7_9PSED|nr:two-component system response regulator [Pseudomonas caspiana]